MTEQQYSELQRCLGKLEGLGLSLAGDAASFFYDTMEVLTDIIDELKEGKE